MQPCHACGSVRCCGRLVLIRDKGKKLSNSQQLEKQQQQPPLVSKRRPSGSLNPNSIRRTITQPITTKERVDKDYSPEEISQQVQQNKIETMAYKAMEQLNRLERDIRESLMIFELTGELPSNSEEKNLRHSLEQIQTELDRWQDLVKKELPVEDNLKVIVRQIRGTRRLIDPSECKDVVTNLIKDPTLFTDINYLANGSYGTVYTAHYLGQFIVVVKVLNGKQWDTHTQELDFFLNEVSTMMSIQGHENILPILGALPYSDLFPPEWKTSPDGITCSPHAIVMPMMPNGTLEDILEKNKEQGKKILLQRQFELAFDICGGMTWVSSRNIVHRDLKPENVFFDKNWICKIGDVGMAEFLTQKKMSTNVGEHLHWWTAPELISGGKPTTKSDIYSCAFVLWQIFTDTSTNDLLYEVFPSEATYNYHENILKGVRPPLDPSHPYIKERPTLRDNKELRDIINKAWDNDPDNRPNFENLLAQLKHALIGVYFPVSVCPDAGNFWESHFPGRIKAPYKSLLTHFQVDFEIEVTPTQNKCLKSFLCKNQKDDEPRVSITDFSLLVQWFGPLKRKDMPFLNYIEHIIEQKWFFGDISASEAEQVICELEDPEPGMFLVRLNLNMDGNKPINEVPFIITRLTDSSSPVLARSALTSFPIMAHTRIHLQPDGFAVFLKEGTTLSSPSPSLVGFVSFIQENHSYLCNKPCPSGWPYRKLFVTTNLQSYQEVEDF